MRWALLFLSLTTLPLRAADADQDWKQLTALDAGPGKEALTAEDVLKISLDHLDAQEKALRAFLKAHPDDERTFSARLRLARLLGLRAELKDQLEPDEVERLFTQAEETANSPQKRADLDFMKVSRVMRRWQGKRADAEARTTILATVRRFQKAHPKDPRIAVLLVETATLYEGAVDTKEALLREANRLADNPGLKAQIADDLKRIGFLGKPLTLQFSGIDGKPHDLKNWRGKPVILFFFATSSEPARTAFVQLQEDLEPFGDGVPLVGVSLDQRQEDVVRFLGERKSAMPVSWDGKGWNGALVKRFGVNAVPSAWLIDQRGVVRSLDVLEDPAGMVKQLR